MTFSAGSIVLVLLSSAFAGLIKWNPLIFGKTSGEDLPKPSEFFVYTEHDVLDEVLQKHVGILEEELDGYRHHCLRTLTFAVFDLGGLRHVRNKELDMMALALAHSKLGWWTSGGTDPVEKSVALLEKHLRKPSKFHHHEFADADVELMLEIVRHGVQPWRLLFQKKTDENGKYMNIARALLKAAWADLTMGVVRSPKLKIAYVERAFTELRLLDWPKSWYRRWYWKPPV